jgi:hypothetical protein
VVVSARCRRVSSDVTLGEVMERKYWCAYRKKCVRVRFITYLDDYGARLWKRGFRHRVYARWVFGGLTMSELFKKKSASPVHPGLSPTAYCQWLVSQYGCVHEYLTVNQYDDGTPRTTSSLNISVFDQRWRVFLNDRENSQSACLSGDSLVEAFTALDLAILDNKMPWRADRQTQARPVGRKKN